MFSSKIFWLFIAVICVTLLYLLSPILTPFLLAALLAYLGDPLVDRLETWRISRTWGVVIVFCGFIALLILIIGVLIPAVNQQVHTLTERMPQYGEWIKVHIGPALSQIFSIDMENFSMQNVQEALQKHLGSASGAADSFLAGITGSIGYVITFATYLVMVPVVTFYLLRDWDILIGKIFELIPRQYRAITNELTRRSDLVLGGFLRGQMMVMLGLGIIYAVGLSILRLDMAIVIGMFAGFVSFVPYLGLIVGVVLASMMALLQFQDWPHVLGVWGVFAVAQMIEATILTPKFVGGRTGLHPVAVLFSVLAGGQLFGFMGVLLALPAAAVINVFLGHFKESYLNSDVYNDVSEDSYKLPKEQYINHEKSDTNEQIS